MELLHLAIIISTIIGIAKGIQLFNRQCRRRFRYSFFTAQGFWLASIGISFLWWGFVAWGSEFLHHEPTSGGLILMTMGLAAVICLIYKNVRDTNLPYGAAGSALQLVLFFPAGIYIFPFLAMILLLLLYATFKAGPAWFINRE